MTQYYAEDIVARSAWWSGILAGVLLLIWSFEYPELMTVAVLQLVMLLAGKWMYPEQRLGRVQDNPLQTKSRVERRYASGRTRTLIAVAVGLVGVLVAQLLILSTARLGVANLTEDVLHSYSLISAAISESYLLHWGLQTNLTAFIHPIAGVVGVPVVAVLLHSMVYGTSGAALLAVGVSFAMLAVVFMWSRRLSVPIVIHLLVNLMVI
jgi:membrane protease YdiL (CAAX protease family)